MDRNTAIREIEWYRNLVRGKIREWGLELNQDARTLLMDNMNEVAERKEKLQFKLVKLL